MAPALVELSGVLERAQAQSQVDRVRTQALGPTGCGLGTRTGSEKCDFVKELTVKYITAGPRGAEKGLERGEEKDGS